jgi:nitroimidazol reductase NimA-like FMN-containing flavoprotein (pyridoxamine 5'-phosphate oxidase superfamily)
MDQKMTAQEREAFLADLHIGILSVADEGRGPLTIPIWYLYEPGGEILIATSALSRKAKLIKKAGRFSLCVQDENYPYKYVSVEGPVVGTEPEDLERHERPLARRYLGVEGGDAYVQATQPTYEDLEMVAIRMKPEQWLSVDYSKE